MYIVVNGFICSFFLNEVLALIEKENALAKVFFIMIPQQVLITSMFLGIIFVFAEVLLVLILVRGECYVGRLLVSRCVQSFFVSVLFGLFLGGLWINCSINANLKNYNYVQCGYIAKSSVKFPEKLYVRHPITCTTLIKMQKFRDLQL
ncbi:hypothetical protein TUM4438_10800 [Shewanella sairae]|uniref:DUF1240 domain-containing protein n=2 Tax=Shewanella sairae TaxID=190310 RepID=A0ABQ4P754_9GAMM|nr:hypothetical protein TUM4438_10800 [Shewanella sairae]